MTVHHQYKDVSNQQDATTFSFINLFKSSLHVSGDKVAHPQEHFLNVYTAFGTMHRSAAMSAYYTKGVCICMYVYIYMELQFHLNRGAGR